MEQPRLDSTSNSVAGNGGGNTSSTSKPKQARIGPFVRRLFTHSSNAHRLVGQLSPESDTTAKHFCSCDISNIQY